MSSTVSATGASGASTAGTESSAASNSTLVSKDAFLKLLVAQIKNQNPLNPADGIEFLGQLAQFSELEQLINISKDVNTLATLVTTTETEADAQAAA
jgi:flagellar basal-body rod modification protein FlgD